jgi:hypothetical protein
MGERTKYQRPGVDSGNLPTEKGYERPDTPSVQDILDRSDKPAPREAAPEVLPPSPGTGLGDAVPVRVVNFARELDRITRTRFYSYAIAPRKAVLVPGQRNRLRAIVRTVEPVDPAAMVELRNDKGVTGFVLVVGQPDLEVMSMGSFWLYNPDDTDTITVSIMEEYVTELR